MNWRLFILNFRFLRGRYKYLTETRSPNTKPEPSQNTDNQSKRVLKQNPNVNGVVKNKKTVKTKKTSYNGAVLRRPSLTSDMILVI